MKKVIGIIILGLLVFSNSFAEKINVKKKIDSMNCFSTEKKSHPHPRSGKALESLAVNRGSHCGFDFAESFEIINTYYI